jgi:hypothetical protein
MKKFLYVLISIYLLESGDFPKPPDDVSYEDVC